MEDVMSISSKMPFDDFYRTYYPRMLKYVKSKINHSDDGEDLTADIFMYCFKHYESYDPALSSPSTWLYLVANSRIKNYYRDFRQNMDIDLWVGVIADDRVDMDFCIYVEQLRKQLESAIECLPPRQQKIISMRYFEEQSTHDIGLEMSMTDVNVRVQLSRALSKLRKLCSHILEGEK